MTNWLHPRRIITDTILLTAQQHIATHRTLNTGLKLTIAIKMSNRHRVISTVRHQRW